MSDNVDSSARAEELASLRAEVARLREALEARAEKTPSRGLMETDPDLPGLVGLWRGERGLAWQLFVQAVVTINVALAVIAVITIASP
jgi:hypothetical protein